MIRNRRARKTTNNKQAEVLPGCFLESWVKSIGQSRILIHWPRSLKALFKRCCRLRTLRGAQRQYHNTNPAVKITLFAWSKCTLLKFVESLNKKFSAVYLLGVGYQPRERYPDVHQPWGRSASAYGKNFVGGAEHNLPEWNLLVTDINQHGRQLIRSSSPSAVLIITPSPSVELNVLTPSNNSHPVK